MNDRAVDTRRRMRETRLKGNTEMSNVIADRTRVCVCAHTPTHLRFRSIKHRSMDKSIFVVTPSMVRTFSLNAVVVRPFFHLDYLTETHKPHTSWYFTVCLMLWLPNACKLAAHMPNTNIYQQIEMFEMILNCEGRTTRRRVSNPYTIIFFFSQF